MELETYGVHISWSTVYVEKLSERIGNIHNEHTYCYIIEISPVSSHNGNGSDLMKIHIGRKLQDITSGNWKVSPMVEMPFYWGGYTPKIQVRDANRNEIVIEVKTGHKHNRADWIKCIVEEILSLSKYKNLLHYNLAKKRNTVKSNLEYDLKRNDPLSYSEYKKYFDSIDELVNLYSDFSKDYEDEDSIHDEIKKEISDLILLHKKLQVTL